MKKILIVTLCFLLIGALLLTGCKPSDSLEGINIYNIELTISEDLETVSLKQDIEVTNNSGDKWDNLKLHLYPNAYQKGATNTAYFNELARYGGIEVTSLTSGGENLSATLQDNLTVLDIKLDAPLAPGKSKVISLSAEIEIPHSPLRLGLSSEILNLANFYPILAVYENGGWREDNYYKVGDPFYSETANYFVSITCLEDLVVATSGNEIETKVKGEGKKTIEIEGYKMRDFAVVASYKFEVLSEKVGDTTVKYYHIGNGEGAKELLSSTVKSLSTFNDLLGKYPYKTYSVVETAFHYGGMEYPGLIFINKASKEKEEIIIHETAHQWFGCMVGSDSINESWLDEGLVTFLSYYYYAKNGDKGKYAEFIKGERDAINSFIRTQKITKGDSYDAKMNKPIYHYATNYEYSMVVYSKGALMFENLYTLTGERKFEKALKKYFSDNIYKNACSDELFAAFRSVGKDIASIAKAWINDEVILSFSYL